MKRRILFLSKGTSASSTRYRATQYFEDIEKLGWCAQHLTISGGLLPFLKIILIAHRFDTVILLRKTFPLPLFQLLRSVCRRLIFDFDDAIFCNTDGSHSKTRLSRFYATVQRVDLVLAGNQYLADQANIVQPNVTVIPTAVPLEKYQVYYPKNNDWIDVVWIGSRSTAKYLKEILPCLEHAAKTVPQLRLKVVADFRIESKAIAIACIPWSEETEAESLVSAHIGLAPLRDDAWSRGKCALKVLQYQAAGLPVISANAGANAEVITHDVTGFLVNSPEEWTKTLIMLAQDRELCKRIGEESRVSVTAYAKSTVFKRMWASIQRNHR